MEKNYRFGCDPNTKFGVSEWTSELPTKTGFYWYRFYKGEFFEYYKTGKEKQEKSIIFIDVYTNPEEPEKRYYAGDVIGSDEIVSLKRIEEMEFIGPIEEPE